MRIGLDSGRSSRGQRRRACASAQRSVGPRGPAVAWGGKPRTGRGRSLPHLLGGERALRQAGVAKADLNFDDAVVTNARANGKRHAMEDQGGIMNR